MDPGTNSSSSVRWVLIGLVLPSTPKLAVLGIKIGGPLPIEIWLRRWSRRYRYTWKSSTVSHRAQAGLMTTIRTILIGIWWGSTRTTGTTLRGRRYTIVSPEPQRAASWSETSRYRSSNWSKYTNLRKSNKFVGWWTNKTIEYALSSRPTSTSSNPNHTLESHSIGSTVGSWSSSQTSKSRDSTP